MKSPPHLCTRRGKYLPTNTLTLHKKRKLPPASRLQLALLAHSHTHAYLLPLPSSSSYVQNLLLLLKKNKKRIPLFLLPRPKFHFQRVVNMNMNEEISTYNQTRRFQHIYFCMKIKQMLENVKNKCQLSLLNKLKIVKESISSYIK